MRRTGCDYAQLLMQRLSDYPRHRHGGDLVIYGGFIPDPQQTRAGNVADWSNGMISHAEVLVRAAALGDKLPLLTLSEFFDGNSDEESLAPNQWGYGRPPLAEIYQRLRALERLPEIHWVRVQLHDDTWDLDEVSAEAVTLCTTLGMGQVAVLLDTPTLDSDGVIEGYAGSEPPDEPERPAGSRVVSIVWD